MRRCTLAAVVRLQLWASDVEWQLSRLARRLRREGDA